MDAQADQQNLESESGRSMLCPRCSSGTQVKDSRPGKENSIRRRRACMGPMCGFRFTTFEVALPSEPIVNIEALAAQITKGTLAAINQLKALEDLVSAAATATRLDR